MENNLMNNYNIDHIIEEEIELDQLEFAALLDEVEKELIDVEVSDHTLRSEEYVEEMIDVSKTMQRKSEKEEQRFVCRLCLKLTHEVRCWNLFDKRRRLFCKELRKKIEYIAAGKINYKVCLNSVICKECLKLICITYNFKRQIITVEDKIMKKLNQSLANSFVDLQSLLAGENTDEGCKKDTHKYDESDQNLIYLNVNSPGNQGVDDTMNSLDADRSDCDILSENHQLDDVSCVLRPIKNIEEYLARKKDMLEEYLMKLPATKNQNDDIRDQKNRNDRSLDGYDWKNCCEIDTHEEVFLEFENPPDEVGIVSDQFLCLKKQRRISDEECISIKDVIGQELVLDEMVDSINLDDEKADGRTIKDKKMHRRTLEDLKEQSDKVDKGIEKIVEDEEITGNIWSTLGYFKMNEEQLKKAGGGMVEVVDTDAKDKKINPQNNEETIDIVITEEIMEDEGEGIIEVGREYLKDIKVKEEESEETNGDAIQEDGHNNERIINVVTEKIMEIDGKRVKDTSSKVKEQQLEEVDEGYIEVFVDKEEAENKVINNWQNNGGTIKIVVAEEIIEDEEENDIEVNEKSESEEPDIGTIGVIDEDMINEQVIGKNIKNFGVDREQSGGTKKIVKDEKVDVETFRNFEVPEEAAEATTHDMTNKVSKKKQAYPRSFDLFDEEHDRYFEKYNKKPDHKLKTKWERFAHRAPQFGKGPFLCPTCGLILQRKHIYKQHLELHRGDRLVICDSCGQLIKEPRLKYHIMAKHQPPMYMCEDCGKKFHAPQLLATHMDTMHKNKNEMHQCQICGKMLRKNSLRGHMRTHDSQQSYTCDVCGITFKGRSYWFRHKKRHTLIKGVPCSYCGKPFKCQDYLSQHIKQVHKRTDYNCLTCHKRLSNRGALRLHIKNLHGPNGMDRRRKRKITEQEKQVMWESKQRSSVNKVMVTKVRILEQDENVLVFKKISVDEKESLNGFIDT